MKARKILIACVLLALAAAGGILGLRAYNAQFVTIGEEKYEKEAAVLDLSGKAVPSIEVLREFYYLEKIDLRGTELSAAEYDALCGEFPQCEVLWDIPFQGKRYSADTEELTVETLSGTDLEALAYFPDLVSVDARDCGDYDRILELRQQRPDLAVSYQVPLGGEVYSWDTEQLSLSGADGKELMKYLPYLTEMKTVELSEPLAPAAELRALQEAFPEITFSWELQFRDMTVGTQTEKLDLTKMDVTVEEMDAVIPYLPSLTYVDMTDCGISNEDMDALNRRYEDVKIVWTIRLGKGHRVRTDIIYYMPYQDDYWPMYNELDNLRYCTDVIALDVGHMEITNCSFVAYMPHLKYLILAETNIRDLEPLRDLKELVYLELFRVHVKDYSPLTTLTALEDLNLCYTQADPKVIAQITWLKNLWWMQVPSIAMSNADKEMLQAAMPDCFIQFKPASSTGLGWRELPNYYAQRDILGMPYMYK